MGILDKNVWSKAKWHKSRKAYPVLSFSVIFLLSFFALIFAPNSIKNIPNEMFISFANFNIDNNTVIKNKNYPECVKPTNFFDEIFHYSISKPVNVKHEIHI